MPWYLSLKGPGLFAIVGIGLLILPEPLRQLGGVPLMVAFLWMLVTAKSRRIYWNARIRSRAHADERDARSGRA